MGRHVQQIVFVEIPHCEECGQTVAIMFSCPACRDPEARTSFNSAPFDAFMRQKRTGFHCRTCYTHWLFAGYDESNDVYLFTKRI